METYTLINVLMFLKNQQLDQYKGIDAIFNIIETNDIPEEEKMAVILAVLRKLGLEEEYVFEACDPELEEPESEERIRRFVPFRVDQFRIKIMDSIIAYDCVLN